MDLPHFPRVLHVDAVHYAARPCGDEVAARHPDLRIGHGRAGQPHRQQRFDLHPQLAARLLHAGESSLVGHARTAHIARARAASGELCLDLRPRAVHQHQPHAQRGQQVEVVSERDELAVGHHLAAEATTKVRPRNAWM